MVHGPLYFYKKIRVDIIYDICTRKQTERERKVFDSVFSVCWFTLLSLLSVRVVVVDLCLLAFVDGHKTMTKGMKSNVKK